MVNSLRKENNEEKSRRETVALEAAHMRDLYEKEATEKEKLADKLQKMKEMSTAAKHHKLYVCWVLRLMTIDNLFIFITRQ